MAEPLSILSISSCLGAVWPKIFSGNFGKKPSSKGKLKRGVTTEVSAKYEDIDDDEMEVGKCFLLIYLESKCDMKSG